VVEGKLPVDIRIGLNIDSVISTNIVSTKRMDYVLVGDGVNFGCPFGISFCWLTSTYDSRDVDSVFVEGETKQVGVYEVMASHNDDTCPWLTDTIASVSDESCEHFKGHWKNAIRSFEEARRMNPDDEVAEIYFDQCCRLEKT